MNKSLKTTKHFAKKPKIYINKFQIKFKKEKQNKKQNKTKQNKKQTKQNKTKTKKQKKKKKKKHTHTLQYKFIIKRFREWRVYQMAPTQYCITSRMMRHTSYNLARNKNVLSCDLKVLMGSAVFNDIETMRHKVWQGQKHTHKSLFNFSVRYHQPR